VKIPAGTQPDTIFRVRGMGFTNRSMTGDLYITTHLVIPTQLNEEQKSFVVTLAEALELKY